MRVFVGEWVQAKAGDCKGAHVKEEKGLKGREMEGAAGDIKIEEDIT